MKCMPFTLPILIGSLKNIGHKCDTMTYIDHIYFYNGNITIHDLASEILQYLAFLVHFNLKDNQFFQCLSEKKIIGKH